MDKHLSSIFSAITMAPRDPTIGITEMFNADANPEKINLGVGVYCDESGKVPLLDCVRKAEARLMEKPVPRTYLPIDGLAAYGKAVQGLVFGEDSAVLREKRAITVQAIGGTGALMLRRLRTRLLRFYEAFERSWLNRKHTARRAIELQAGMNSPRLAWFDQTSSTTSATSRACALARLAEFVDSCLARAREGGRRRSVFNALISLTPIAR